jgi:hypothetical protein
MRLPCRLLRWSSAIDGFIFDGLSGGGEPSWQSGMLWLQPRKMVNTEAECDWTQAKYDAPSVPKETELPDVDVSGDGDVRSGAIRAP